jgi:acyl-CoA thioester hydrolase
MTQPFTRRFRVRHYELDVTGRVQVAAYVRYMQEAAIEASAAVGFDTDWYRAHETGWVIRRLAVRCHAAAAYGDEVAVRTWVSEMRGVRSTREYDLRRASDGARLARARVHWVYLDLRTGALTRFPAAFAEAFAPSGEVPDLHVRLRRGRPAGDSRHYRSRWRVEFHELDTARHVNHAVYVQWLGQAHRDALRAAGHPPDVDRLPWHTAYDVEYLAPALDGDEVDIVSRVTETSRLRQAWLQEVLSAGGGKLLARASSLALFLGADGRPVEPEPQLLSDLLGGPAAT